MSITALKIVEQHPGGEQLSGYCKAVGDVLRLEVLSVLQHNAYSVLELCQLFGVRQPAMSHHLKVLANAGFVATRREGNTIFYRRAPAIGNPLLSELHRALLATIDKMELAAELVQKINQLHLERSETSRQFFQDNAQRFEANQDLIARYQDYESSVVEIMDSSVTCRNSALEIGTGQGEFLAELSPRFKQVYAVDNVDELLTFSKAYAQRQGLKNIEFILGDIANNGISLPHVDCISLNMVLHHLPQPAKMFSVLSNLLEPGGVLVLTDLCQHQQQWVNESCGDLWQGFAPEDLNHWAEAANLLEGQSLYLAMRNGFRIQIRVFKKPL